MKNMECPVQVQKELNAREAYSLVVTDSEEAGDENSAKIELECSLANCAVQAVLGDRSSRSGEMTTFGVANPQLCALEESPIETNISIPLP